MKIVCCFLVVLVSRQAICGIIRNPPAFSKPVYSDSYLPAAMQVVFHAVEQLKLLQLEETADTSTTTSSPSISPMTLAAQGQQTTTQQSSSITASTTIQSSTITASATVQPSTSTNVVQQEPCQTEQPSKDSVKEPETEVSNDKPEGSHLEEEEASKDQVEQSETDETVKEKPENASKDKAEESKIEKASENKMEGTKMEETSKDQVGLSQTDETVKKKLENASKDKAEESKIEKASENKMEGTKMEETSKDQVNPSQTGEIVKQKLSENKMEGAKVEETSKDQVEQSQTDQIVKEKLENASKDKVEKSKIEKVSENKMEGTKMEQTSKSNAVNRESMEASTSRDEESPEVNEETPESNYATPETNYEAPEMVHGVQETNQEVSEENQEGIASGHTIAVTKLEATTASGGAAGSSTVVEEKKKLPTVDSVVQDVYQILKPAPSKLEDTESSEESKTATGMSAEKMESVEEEDDEIRFTRLGEKVTQVPRPSLSSYLRRSKVPPNVTLQQLANLYDSLSKDARKQGFGRYTGYSDEVLNTLVSSAEGGIGPQLKKILAKVLERNELTREDARTRTSQAVKDLDNPSSSLSKELRPLLPLRYSP